MSDDKRRTFQERVARLEARKQAEAKAAVDEQPKGRRTGPKSQVPLVLGLAAASFVGLGASLGFSFFNSPAPKIAAVAQFETVPVADAETPETEAQNVP